MECSSWRRLDIKEELIWIAFISWEGGRLPWLLPDWASRRMWRWCVHFCCGSCSNFDCRVSTIFISFFTVASSALILASWSSTVSSRRSEPVHVISQPITIVSVSFVRGCTDWKWQLLSVDITFFLTWKNTSNFSMIFVQSLHSVSVTFVYASTASDSSPKQYRRVLTCFFDSDVFRPDVFWNAKMDVSSTASHLHFGS
jgi:hypothetical protein